MADTTATKKTASKRSSTKKSAANKSSAKKTPAKKTSAKKTSAAKKTTAKKSPAKASTQAPPAKKSSAKKSVSRDRPQRGARRDDRSSGGTGMAAAAYEVVRSLTGKSPESITGLERSDEGWRVSVDVLELERIPSTTDVLAIYEVTLDEQGELQGYRRVHRYLRGSAGDE